jgi:hypothetical protein
MWQPRLGVVVLLALSSACGASQSQTVSSPTPASDQIPVRIDNESYSDMEIYVVQNGQRLLVGQANGLTKTTLTIRGATRGDGRIRLLAEPIGASGRIISPTLVVPRGQSIFWTIGSDPATSTAYTG